MKTILIFFCLSISFLCVSGQDKTPIDSISLLFIGDIMGHDSQIIASYDSVSNSYNYLDVFKHIRPILENTDFTIANLEVTLSGPPYKGYPKFSSPDELAVACKQNGIDVLVTANNHSNDRGAKGILRTLNVLDSLNINHTGTFRNSIERNSSNLLILTKNSIKLGILNYTYGTNKKSSDYPAIVNRIDTTQMLDDIIKSKLDSLDKLIVILHWGKEYQSTPSKYQKQIALFLYNNGVDIIIGAHPHVLQPMVYYPKTTLTNEVFIAFSLGNFVSNQRNRKRDGGAMVQLNLIKQNEVTSIKSNGYYLTWVNKPKVLGKTTFEVISCSNYKKINNIDLDEKATSAIHVFAEDSRKLLKSKNQYVEELQFSPTGKE